MQSYYGRRAPNQMQGIITRPAVGLNLYSPPTSINDNYLSDAIDVRPYRNEALESFSNETITKLCVTQGTDIGSLRSILDSSVSTDAAYTFYLMTSLAASWKLHKLYYDSTTPTITSYTMTTVSVPADPTIYEQSSIIFTTEATTYYCFCSSHEKRLHFIKVGTTETYGYVDLPFYPCNMVTHANRIFIADDKNKIWWCKAGDPYSWYSQEYNATRLMASANMKNGAYTLIAQPDTARVITATRTVTDTADTPGILTIVGTDSLGNAITSTLTPLSGRTQTTQAFMTVVSITGSGWTQGGATPDTITLGTGPVGLGYIQEDSGYWTVERENKILDLCTIGNAIYLFGPSNIYIFQGTSPDTFAIQQIIADMGIHSVTNPGGYNCLATAMNRAYFYSNNEIYEFDGNNSPRVITRPVYVNNALTNSIMGGISLSDSEWVLEADDYGLYVYDKTNTNVFYYYFHFESRTWWKQSGMVSADVGAASAIIIRYVHSFSKKRTFSFITVNDTIADVFFSLQLGKVQSNQPFIVTKAFNTNPSETGTLTELILMVGAESGYTADIEVLYSLSEDADDFQLIKTFENLEFNGDIQILSVPVPVSYIASSHHYRIKLILGKSYTEPIRVYNIERRFRIQGRSR